MAVPNDAVTTGKGSNIDSLRFSNRDLATLGALSQGPFFVKDIRETYDRIIHHQVRVNFSDILIPHSDLLTESP